MQQEPEKQRREPSADERRLWSVSGMGMELVGAIVGMWLLGLLIDRAFETGARWQAILVVVGVIGGMYNFIRKALALNK